MRKVSPELLEARDPTTPSERLRVIYVGATRHRYDAIVTNPGLPLDLLRQELLEGSVQAWHNPAVPALLLAEPLPEYEAAARRALGRLLAMNEKHAATLTLRGLFVLLARQESAQQRRAERLAHRLSQVFDVPWAVTPSVDELRREAGDLTTPGERLRELFSGRQPTSVRTAAIGNPGIPVDLLALVLSVEMGAYADMPSYLVAWHNPTAALALMAHPHPRHRAAALKTLLLVEDRYQALPGLQRARTLEDAVATWASYPITSARAEHAHIRDLARHLAGLFSLPWPEQP
ncbi:MAG: hypothetical protein EOO70_02260 [Myxococcaceae bacterium]|nr:MAG: hypothetical protein EOO70_02260 [Myxococcaceae bacterium]